MWQTYSLGSLIAGAFESAVDKAGIVGDARVDSFAASFYRSLCFTIATVLIGLTGLFGGMHFFSLEHVYRRPFRLRIDTHVYLSFAVGRNHFDQRRFVPHAVFISSYRYASSWDAFDATRDHRHFSSRVRRECFFTGREDAPFQT